MDLTSPDSSLEYADEELAAFLDHRPAGRHHLLVVTRRHIRSVTHLSGSADDTSLIRRMEALARRLLSERGADMSDVRLGFHWKLVTVGHLHLHAISPTHEMSWLQKLEFSSWILASVGETIKMLETKNS